MVNYNVFTTGEDYRCNISLRGNMPQQALLEYHGCDLVAQREEPMLEDFVEGQTIDLEVYDLPPHADLRKHSTLLKKADGTMIANVSLQFRTQLSDDKPTEARIIHFKIDDSARRMGLGTTVLLTLFGFAELMDGDDMHIWIGGDGTDEWLVENGVPPSDIGYTSSGNVSFDTSVSTIDYDRARLSVERTDEPVIEGIDA